MSKSKFNDLIEILSNANPSAEELEKMGLTRQEFDLFRSDFDVDNIIYNRILADDERRALTPEAFGYLLELVEIGSINKEQAEDIIFFSTQLYDFVPHKINKIMMDEIINFAKFSEEIVTLNDVMELFLVKKNFIQFKGNVN